MDGKKAKEILKKRYDKQNAYNKDNYDRINLVLPKGTKDRLKTVVGGSVNAFISALIIAELDKLEGLTVPGQTPTEKPKPQPVEVPQGVADPTAEEKVRQWLAEQERKKAEDQDSTNTATANRTRSI